MHEASLLWYHDPSSKLKGIGFKFNPYDVCVCNQIINDKHQKVRFHVDDILLCHIDKELNNDFHTWLDSTFED